MMSSFRLFIEQYLAAHLGDTPTAQRWLTFFLLVASLLLAAMLISVVFRRYLSPLLHFITRKTPSHIDDILFAPSVLNAVAWVIPGLIFSAHLASCYTTVVPRWVRTMLEHGVELYNVVCLSLLIVQIVGTLNELMKRSNRYGDYHFDGIFQALKLLIYIVMAIIVIAVIIGQKPTTILTGIGASAAILMLVFKDTIMGFVASIQLTSNKMIKRQDWVAIDRLGINGVVEEVNLTTVKIRNWDNSISTVPPYTLVSETFQNWTEMQQLGARLMRRTILIDLSSVRRDEGSKEVNLTRFRQHVMELMLSHPRLLPGGSCYVRLLSTTPHGVPMELVCYFTETNAGPFDALVADFMEQVFASLPEFGLRVFQISGDRPVV